MSLALRGWESTAGERSRTRKLTQEQAQQILDLKGTGQTEHAVAEQFGVTKQNVGNIWRRSTWKHLTRKTNAIAQQQK